MKFLRQNFVTDIAAVVPSLLHSLGENGAGLVSSPQQPPVSEPHCGGDETGNSGGVSRFR
jgi:hypothetical protein